MTLKPAIACAGLIVLLHYGPARAFPDGAPWDMDITDGCVMCHFDSEPATDFAALALTGLPDRLRAGERYRLTIALDTPDMAASGMMITSWLDGRPIGTMQASDNRIEAKDNKARSTGAAGPWHVIWQAPQLSEAQTIRFTIWANAANGDGSPFGDRVFRLQTKHRLTP